MSYTWNVISSFISELLKRQKYFSEKQPKSHKYSRDMPLTHKLEIKQKNKSQEIVCMRPH